MAAIRSYKELRVYQAAVAAAMRIFEITKTFPPEEKYSMVDQMRRSSCSVCSNIAESWRKRRYKAHFISKLTDAEGEADETCVWLELVWHCHYIDKEVADEIDQEYDRILGQLVTMEQQADQWVLR
jgi:four helix bundle protein